MLCVRLADWLCQARFQPLHALFKLWVHSTENRQVLEQKLLQLQLKFGVLSQHLHM
jgi:hypothetical protein